MIAKYEDNLKESLIQPVMAGGDPAAREMIVGIVLGAHLGEDNISDKNNKLMRFCKKKGGNNHVGKRKRDFRNLLEMQ